jgi:DNA-directed RNA polymerase III subunit RPC1
VLIGDRGFSIGIDDVEPGDILRQKKDSLVEEAYAECDRLIEDKKMGRLVTQPGCNEEQTLEASRSTPVGYISIQNSLT